MRHYDVITIGEATIDAFMTLDQGHHERHIYNGEEDICFRHGEKIDVDTLNFCIGGNATNVAVGLRRLGLKSTICTEIGDDEFSLKIHNTLAREDIDRLFVVHTKDSISNFAAVINYKAERTIFVKNLEREHDFKLDDVKADYIYLTSLGHDWKKPYKYALDFAKENGCKMAFNPGSLQLLEKGGIVYDVLEKTDILFVNKEEAESLVLDRGRIKFTNGHEYIKKLLTKLREFGAKTVVITNGVYGSFVYDTDNKFHYRSNVPGNIVERTGAGDAYSSGFLAAIIHGQSVKEAMLWGSVNAAFVVGHIGAQTGLLKKSAMMEQVVKYSKR